MGILHDLGLWRRARPIVREAVIEGPDNHQTIVWEVEPKDVGVIHKLKDGKFLGFQTEPGKQFGRVVAKLRRQARAAGEQRGLQ